MFDTVHKASCDRSWHHNAANVEVIAVASSAGGILALREVIGALPADFPLPVLIAQHCGTGPDPGLARILGFFTKMHVKTAEEGESLRGGTVYVAPSGRHLELAPGGAIQVTRTERYQFVRPSADLLFESVADCYGARALAVVLTGLGRDGARGVPAVRKAGGFVIAQDEASSAYFDMPRAAIETRKVDLVLSLEQIAFALRVLSGANDVPLRTPVRGRPAIKAQPNHQLPARAPGGGGTN